MSLSKRRENRRTPRPHPFIRAAAGPLLITLMVLFGAAPATSFEGPGVPCNEDPQRPDNCHIPLAEGLAIDAGRTSLFPHADGLGYDAFGNVEIPTGQAPLVLAPADMRFRTINGRSTLQYATALLPFPQMGFLSNIKVDRQPMVSFGVRRDNELGFTGAPLQGRPRVLLLLR